MTDSEKITGVFLALRKKGWFARKKWKCCQSCGCAAIDKSYKDKFVFYHSQDADSIKEDGNIKGGLYLTHGEGGNAKEIVKSLKDNGLRVKWNGDMNTRILVEHKE